jgi:hypothetical protein
MFASKLANRRRRGRVEELPICANLQGCERTQYCSAGFEFVVGVGQREPNMLWTLFVVLMVLWLLGVVSSYTMGGFIHILLVLAVVALVFQLISGRRSAI